ncbi:MAG TPA: hypothetical protein VH062_02900 [Polyangiaceae bacterium]|jgi:hypothetical protein|nr:hypothetical protein [Polyangiaceae bacterium]
MIAHPLLDDCLRDHDRTAERAPRRSLGRSAPLAVALGLSLFVSACGPSAAEQKAKFDDIQKKADDHVAAMDKQYKDQLAASQKSIDECQQKLTDATTQAKTDAQKDAEEEVTKAHAEADKLAAEAAKALAGARAAYKETERQNFASLSKDVEDLRQKAAKAPAKTKPQIDKAMKDLVTKRDAAAKEIPELDKATLETLRTTKVKVDQKLAILKQAIHALRAKLT